MAKKKKKPNRSALKKKAWDAFSKYIRLRDAILTMTTDESFRCISCNRETPVKGNHAGHFVGGRHDAVLFHEDIVNGQCLVCNIRRGGEYILYEKALRKRYGYARVEEFKELRWASEKYTHQDLIEIRAKYIAKIEQVEKWHNSGCAGLPPGVDERSL